MSKEQIKMMRQACEIVTRFRETNELWKGIGNKKIENDTWHEYVGAMMMFEKLFGIDYHEAQDIFNDHFMEVPF